MSHSPAQRFLLVLLALLGACQNTEPTPKPRESVPETPERAQTMATSPSHQLRLDRATVTIRDSIQTRRIDDFLKTFSAGPRMPGHVLNRKSAESVYHHFLLLGLEARIDEYEVLAPEPLEVLVELLRPVAFRAALREEPIANDYDTHVGAFTPPHVLFSADGDVTGALVYVHTATPEDFEELEKLQVTLSGAIGIARESALPVCDQVRNAERAGLAGLIVYGDPEDVGFRRGNVYPKGPFRPESGALRTHALPPQAHLGDPLTPGQPARPPADNINARLLSDLPRIPCTTLSAADAAPLLRHLGGQTAKAAWQGGLPFTYHLGGGEDALVRLRVATHWKTARIWNVVGILKGSLETEHQILVLAQRDSFGHGAQEAASGTAALLECASVLKTLSEGGSPPLRSLVFCSLDGGSMGHFGAVEFLEHHRDSLAERVAFALNLDQAVAGDVLSLEVHPLLHSLALHSLRRGLETESPATPQLIQKLRGGHDRSSFSLEQALGIPAMHLHYHGHGANLKTLLDTYASLKRFTDPDLSKHRTLIEQACQLLYRSATEPIVDMDFAVFLDTLSRAVKALEPDLPEAPRTALQAELSELARQIPLYNLARNRALRSDPDPTQIRTINRILATCSRLLADDRVLPERPSFRNWLTGIDPRDSTRARHLPDIHDALLSLDPARLTNSVDLLSGKITALTRLLKSLTHHLTPSARGENESKTPTGV